LREQVLLAMEQGRDDDAFTAVRHALRATPDEPQIIFLMAMLLADRHRYPEAIKLLDDLAEDVPSSQLPVWGQTAEWMVRFGQYSEAESRYRTLLKEVPDSVQVHRNLSQLLIRQGRRSQAAAHLQQLTQWGNITEAELRTMLVIAYPLPGDAEQEDREPIGDLGWARSEISQGNWQAALQRLQASKSRDAQQTALLGRVYAHLGRSEELQDWFNAVSQSSTDTSTPDAEAESAAESEYADHWVAMGGYFAERDEHSRAARCFCAAVLRDPTDARVYHLLADSLRKLDATQQADEADKRAKLIETTQELGAEMASSENRENAKMLTLIDRLDQLQRPLEALAWRGVRLAYARSYGSLTDAQARQAMAEIVQERSQRLKTNRIPASRDFLLCGVDLDSLQPVKRDDAADDTEP
jgi:tetratricopeptide (TPR) repeat protein